MVNLAFGFSTFEGGPVIMLEDFIVAAAEHGRGSGRFFMEVVPLGSACSVKFRVWG